MSTRTDDRGLAARHGNRLLAALGVETRLDLVADHPALAWRRAGLMAVTGTPDGPSLVAPVALTSVADGALAALRALAPDRPLPLSGALLLGERARLLGLSRQGAVSANGTCRLLATRDVGMALSLSRPDDWEVLPALLGEDASDWPTVSRCVAAWDTAPLVERARLFGLAAAPDRAPTEPTPPFRLTRVGPPRRGPGSAPLVVDLSSLWAGPLAGSLLAAAGARVVKVESCRRPDGARQGNPLFFALMNAGKASVALDFADPADLARLRGLIASADIVIEASRPRALRNLGIDAAAVARAGATWISITGHGREGDAADWIGFGDDTAVAGGLSARMRAAWGKPLFAGDAIGDPLTGITAALCAWSSWRAGGGTLIALALADVVADACGLVRIGPREIRAWQALANADTAPLYHLRSAIEPARELGVDTEATLAAL